MDIVNAVLEYATQALVPLLLAILGVAARTWMQTHSREKALDAVTAALTRAAAIASEALVAGEARTPAAAAASMAEQVAKALPDALAVLKPTAGALESMALGVLLQRVQARQDARDGALPAPAA